MKVTFSLFVGMADQILLDRAISHFLKALQLDPDLDFFLFRCVEVIFHLNRVRKLN